MRAARRTRFVAGIAKREVDVEVFEDGARCDDVRTARRRGNRMLAQRRAQPAAIDEVSLCAGMIAWRCTERAVSREKRRIGKRIDIRKTLVVRTREMIRKRSWTRYRDERFVPRSNAEECFLHDVLPTLFVERLEGELDAIPDPVNPNDVTATTEETRWSIGFREMLAYVFRDGRRVEIRHDKSFASAVNEPQVFSGSHYTSGNSDSMKAADAATPFA